MKHFSFPFSSLRIGAIVRSALLFVLLLGATQAGAQISVTATAGTLGPTVYATLNGAIGAVNAGTHQGDVLLTVTGNTTETIQSTLNQSGFGAASYTTVTIKPAAATTPTITGNIGTGILMIFGSNVTINGCNNAGGVTRDLTIQNTSTTANSYVVRIASPSTTLGAINDMILNTNINSSNALNLGCGVMVGSGVTTFSYAEAPNNKTLIRNNLITGAEYSIFYEGCVASPDNQAEISNNTMSFTVSGIWFTFCQNSIISGNTLTGTPVGGGFAFDGILVNGTMVNVNVFNNNISAIRNTSTAAGSAAYGIFLSAFNGPVNVYNNFVYNVASGGNATSTSNGEGIYVEQGGGYYIYHNTVNLTTSQTSAAGAPAAFMVGAGVTSAGAMAVVNNIFANSQTGGSTQRYSIYNNSALGSNVFAAIDNNEYYTASGPNLGFQSGSGALLNLTAVRTAMGGNVHSLSVIPPFVSTTDPHINIVACSGTPLESGGASVGITTDIDGQVRPGPALSTCGGGTAPDIGADEFDGGINDATPPAIIFSPAFAPIPNICSPADVTLSGVTLVDATGVPTAGALMPRIYFQKNAGPWISAPGTLASGTTISGSWNFTITVAALGGLATGDVVNYYVIAQDNFGNITANPAAGLVATDVNTVTTPPTTPNSYAVGTALSGTYTVGAAGTYPTLTAAINAYNTACLLGPVVFLLTDPNYPSETFPITVRYNSSASAVNTLTIKPAATTNITGGMPGSGLFYFYGARYVTIDGSNSGTTSQDLTWSNVGVAGNSYVIRFGTPSLLLANNNNTVKNCIVTNGSATTSTYCFLSGSGGATIGNAAECVNRNNTIQNNNISNGVVGIYINGFASTADSNWTVNSNTVQAGRFSLDFFNMQYSNIYKNILSTYGVAAGSQMGVLLNAGSFYNVNIYANNISGISTAGAFGAYGIYLNTNSSSSGVNIFNNFISNVYNTTGNTGTVNNGFGLYVAFGTGYNILENSINMGTNQPAVGGSISAAINVSYPAGAALPGSINLVDNILSNNQTAGVVAANRYAIYNNANSPSTVFGTINYNDYYTTGTNLGFVGGLNRATLAAMQTGYGGNLNSINLSPTFVSVTDLHLQLLAANLGLNTGVTVSGITQDIDGDTRISPTMGADELILCPLTITGSPTTVCVGGTTNLTDAVAGGTWSSAAGTGNATVSATGLVTGTLAGTATISYTIAGCSVTQAVTVNPGPFAGAITGSLNVCPTTTTALSDPTGDPGGVWTSSTSNATVGTSGIVTGVTAGTSTISYTVTSSCGSVSATTIVTVNPSPNAGTIFGTFTLCPTTSASLTDALSSGVGAGTWSSVSTGVATITATGVVTGVSAGTSIISYLVSNSCGTVAATQVITVNPAPVAGTITGSLTVCPAISTTLSNATGGAGVWSSVSTGVATVSATGVVTGVTSGTSIISYTVTNSCGTVAATATVTVNPNPNAGSITGIATVCALATTNLTDAATGGNWSSVSTGVATVSATGVAGGVSAGTSTISYTVTNSCGTAAATVIVTVNPLPNAGTITGLLSICPTTTSALTDAAAGGTWSSVSTGVATVSATGAVTGVSSGTSTISYTVTNSCGTAAATTVVTVSATPNGGSITGGLVLCPATTTALTDAASGGNWSSVATGVATVSATGVVTGIANGTSTISYTVTNSCGTAAATAIVTVNSSPSAGSITGGLVVCPTATTALTDATGGGVWSSVSTGVATVSATGVVTGVTNGTSIISYTVTNSCGTIAATATVTVDPSPNAGTIAGTFTLCPTATTTLTDATPLGLWTSTNTLVATVSGTGVVTGVSGGTSTISYAVTSSCGVAYATATVTVNPSPNAGSITGTLHVCPTTSTTLADAAGGGTGVWSSGATGTATVSGTGVVTGVSAGTATISYAVTNVCATAYATTVVTVDPSPNAGVINGTLTVCPAATTTLTDAATGGAWSSVSGGIASVSTAGTVTGIAAGTSTISYTVTNSCGTVASTAVVTVNPLPTAGFITGTFSVCPSTTSALTDATTGGVWSSLTPSLASVDAFGIVTGHAAGTTTISYGVTNSCATVYATADVTINPSPYAGVISGSLLICQTNSTTLTDGVAGGTWSSALPGVASISATGLMTGVTLGTATISYAVANMCGTAYATAIATINPLPIAGTITGGSVVCPGTTVTLSDPASGGSGTGVWSSSPTTIVTVGSTTGIVTGVTTGTATITYTVSNTCGSAFTTTTVTVHPFPKPISGLGVLCQANAITVSDSVADGVWSSSNAAIAIVAPAVSAFPTGLVSGITTGTVDISYVVAPGCYVTKAVTINPLGAISAAGNMCVGSTQTATDLPGGGSWTSSNPTVATVDPATGQITAMESGATIISYTLGAGCTTGVAMTVNMLPANYYVTGGGTFCSGAGGVHVGLDGSDTGVTHQLVLATSVLSTRAGTGSAIDFGAESIPGTYSVIAVNDITGCIKVMGGSAEVVVGGTVTPFVTLSTSPGTTVCVGTPALFTPLSVNGGTAPVYTWYVNGVNVSTSSTYGYIPNNGDSVSVMLTSNAACASPATATAYVLMTTTTGVSPMVTIVASPGDSVCPGTPVTLTPFPSFGGFTPSYHWIKNGIFQTTGSTYTYMPVGGDNIYCWMFSSFGCALYDSVASNNVNLVVPVITAPAVTVSAYPGNKVAFGDTVMLVAGVGFTGLGVSYQWEINGLPVPGATNDTFRSSFNNHDSVTCLVTGYSTCGSATRDASVTIVDTVTLGIHNLQDGGELGLLPNPNTGTFTIKGTVTGDNDLEVMVTDMLGQVIYERKVATQNGKVNEQILLSNTLANGMYLLNARSGGESKVFHFVVEK